MEKRVLGVLGGDGTKLKWLKHWLESADTIYAADAGADLVLRAGHRTDTLVGDFDSVSDLGKASASRVIEVTDQDTSDCDKLLSQLSADGISEVTLVGAEGTRIDHMLGILQSISRWSGRARVAYQSQLARVLSGPQTLGIECSGNLSAIPLSECRSVYLKGVRWPLSGADLGPTTLSSLSNHAEGWVEVSVASGTLVVIWNYDGQPFW